MVGILLPVPASLEEAFREAVFTGKHGPMQLHPVSAEKFDWLGYVGRAVGLWSTIACQNQRTHCPAARLHWPVAIAASCAPPFTVAVPLAPSPLYLLLCPNNLQLERPPRHGASVRALL